MLLSWQRLERTPEDVLNKVDDLDTSAFMETIEVFTAEQKEPAIQIASKYRAQLYERRAKRRAEQQARRRNSPGKRREAAGSGRRVERRGSPSARHQ